MILNTDYERQIYVGLSTDDWGDFSPNEGGVVYLMDQSKCYIFDGSTMQELPDLGGGGGGSITAIDVIQELTLTENVRAVRVDIPSGYDWVYMLINGQFTVEDWLYWGINVTNAENYQPTTLLLQTGFAATNRTSDGHGEMWGIRNNGTTFISTASGPMEFLHIRGYSHDIKAGTKIYTYGGKYANL